MKKGFIAVLTILLMLTACVSLSSCIGDDVEGGVIYSGVWAIGCEDDVTEVTLRDGTAGIKSGAFSGRSDITKITIPDSVRTVMNGAFTGCDGIITTQDGVRYVDGWVIDASETVSTVKIKEGTRGIADEAFYDCRELGSIEVPNSVFSIGTRAFYGCNSIVSISLPFIGQQRDGTLNNHFGYIFGASDPDENAEKVPHTLETVTVTGDTAISAKAFTGCKSIKTLKFEGEIENIGEYAFSECTSLTEFTANGSYKTIGRYAFFRCRALKRITLPEGLTDIGNYAFAICRSLEAIEAPNTLKTIGEGAFVQCDNATTLTLPEGLEHIGQQAFDTCNALTSVNVPDCDMGKMAFYKCEGLTAVTLSEGRRSIPEGAFEGCTALHSVKMPKSLTEICESAFYGCSSLESVNLEEGLVKIEKSAFSQCFSLNSISLPESLTELGEQAFYGTACAKKGKDGVSVVDGWIVGASASIIKLTLAEDIIGIANNAFAECYGLTDVYYAGDAAAFGRIKLGEENDPFCEAEIHYGNDEKTD